MRLRLAVALCAFAVAGLASAPAASAREVRLAVGETVILEIPAASAAFAIDTTTVEANAIGGQVVLIGRRAGQTLVTVVTPGEVETLTVRVEAGAARALAVETSRGPSAGAWEGRYDSGTGRVSSDLAMTLEEEGRVARLRLFGIREGDGGGDRDGILAFPAASLELTAPGRSLILLDELVEASPLTLDGTVLRGLHLRQGAWTVHAGVASATPWDDLLLPSSGDQAFGLAYRHDAGSFRLVPAVLWLPDGDTEVPGVLSLGFERGADADPLRLRGELGWSDEPGAALDLTFRGRRQHAWFQGEHRPAAFAALGVAQPAGTYLDGAWSGQIAPRTHADLTVSANRLDLAGRRQESGSARFELRHQASERWSLTAGLAGSGYRDRDREAEELRRSVLSLGAAYDASAFGVATLYRFQETSATSTGGHGGRMTVRGSRGPWRGRLFVDAHQDAPTLDLVLLDRPDLARAFAELGFVARTPEEVIRLVRDNAALFAERGVTVGDLDLDPLRVHGGLDLSWRPASPRRNELGLRLVMDDAESVAGGRQAFLGTFTAARRVFADTDLMVAYTRWSTRREGIGSDDRDSLEVAVRTGLSGIHLPGGGGAITGQVLHDRYGTGELASGLPPLAGVEVILDDGRSVVTGADGRFTFSAPGSGEHRVQAVLPPVPGAYFTAPSVLRLPSGGEALFAVTFSAARLAGTVRNDAGLPLAGVTLRLAGATAATATTDSRGAYRFAAPAGEVTVSLVADSLPPGYDLRDLATEVRHLSPDAPASADFTVRALRTLSGVVAGAGETTQVSTLETGHAVTLDEQGRFLLRGLPSGLLTLVVRSPHGESRRRIEVPEGPASVTGVELPAP